MRVLASPSMLSWRMQVSCTSEALVSERRLRILSQCPFPVLFGLLECHVEGFMNSRLPGSLWHIQDYQSSDIYLLKGSYCKSQHKGQHLQGKQKGCFLESVLPHVISSQHPAAHAWMYTRCMGRKGTYFYTVSSISHCDPLACLFGSLEENTCFFACLLSK